MHIKLISPKVTQRSMDSEWKPRMSPPLSLLVLGALTPPEHTVTLADENIERVRFDDSPDLVGITVKVDTVVRSTSIAARYRARGIPVVMGGIHPTVCPDDCLARADSVVVGEAEIIWPKLLEDLENNKMLPLYKNSEPVCTGSIPIPRRDLLNAGKYLFTNTLLIGRGCPWRCDFCYNSSPNIANRYRHKSIKQVIDEIESINSRHIMFIDDNFIGNPVFTRQLLPHLKEHNLTWHAAVSADVGRHTGLLEEMADCGCKSLFIGFESVNSENLECCGKVQNKTEHYNTTISRIHSLGMMVNASVVFGFDSDDESVFETTLNWLIQNKVATMTAHILTPYPGTGLYRKLKAEGRITDTNLNRYNTSHVVFKPARLSAERLENGYRDIYRKFYSWESIWKRRPAKAEQIAAYFQFQLLYRKFGKTTCHLGRLFGMRRLANLARIVAYPATVINRKSSESLTWSASANYGKAVTSGQRG